MKYVILNRQNRAARPEFLSLPDEVRAEGMAGYLRLNDELHERGEWVAGEALAEDSASVVVSGSGGVPVRTDGPFAEAKELLAGFYVVHVDSLDRAVERAGRIHDLLAGAASAEVHPVLDYGMPDA